MSWSVRMRCRGRAASKRVSPEWSTGCGWCLFHLVKAVVITDEVHIAKVSESLLMVVGLSGY
ncbi:hypothetical protein FAGKG844_260066 [Frankia sp. AgKG'84/4]